MSQYISLPVEMLNLPAHELKVYAILRASSELNHFSDQGIDLELLAANFGLDHLEFLLGICVLRLQGFVLIPSSLSFDELLAELIRGEVVVQIVDRGLSVQKVLDLNPGFLKFVESCSELTPPQAACSSPGHMALYGRIEASAKRVVDALAECPEVSGLLTV